MARSANSPILGPSGIAFRSSSQRFLADFTGGGFDTNSPDPVTQPGNGGGFAAPNLPNPLGVPAPGPTGTGGGFAAPPGSYRPQAANSSDASSSSSSSQDTDPMRWGLIALGALVILLGLYEVTR